MHDEDNDALALLQDVYRDESLPLFVRLRAANVAVRYERPTLTAVALGDGTKMDGMAQRLQRARARVARMRQLRYIDADYEEVEEG